MREIGGILLDLDGVLYEGDTPIPNAAGAVIKERYPIRFITNTTRKTHDTVYEKLLRTGFEIESDVFGAQRAGLIGCLVKTGKFREKDLKRGIEPDYILDSVVDLPGLLLDV